MNLAKITHALERLGTTPRQMWDRAVKTGALKLADKYLAVAESTATPEQMAVYQEEVDNFRRKLAEEDPEWFGTEMETTDEPGKIRDSGGEKSMKIEGKALAEAVAEGIRMEKQEEADILNAARRTGHRESSLGSQVYYPHLDKDSHRYVKEAKPNTSLDEDNVLAIVKGNRG